MKQIIYNAQTKETTIVEVSDVEMPVSEPVSQIPTLEELTVAVADLTARLNDKGLIP